MDLKLLYWFHIRKLLITPIGNAPLTKTFLRYGSVITTHLLQDPELSGRIASIVIVDPVSILLHLPDVAYNFVCAFLTCSPPANAC